MSLETLRSVYSWPDSRPAWPAGFKPERGMWSEARAATFREIAATAAPSVVLELGAWAGHSARWFLETFPAATMISVDHWQGSDIHHRRGPLPILAHIFDIYRHNLWNERNRVIPVRADSLSGMRAVAAHGVQPDLIYVDAAHDRLSVLNDVRLAGELFPLARLTGDDYHDDRVKLGVADAIHSLGISPTRLRHDGVVWWIADRDRLDYAAVVESIRRGDRVVFSRWGDGEWSSLLGKVHGVNCDGVRYTRRLAESLSLVLEGRPPYTLALQGLARRQFGPELEAWLGERGLGSLAWADADIFYRASRRTHLRELFDALHTRRTVVVGPTHLRQLAARFPVCAFVEVPTQTAFEDRERIIQETHAAMVTHKPDLVSLSAGPAAKVILDRLVREEEKRGTPGPSIIDFGSVWDPYCGVLSRKYMANLPAA